MKARVPTDYFSKLKFNTIEFYEYMSKSEPNQYHPDSIFYDEDRRIRDNVKLLKQIRVDDNSAIVLSKHINSIDLNNLIYSRCLPKFTCGIIMKHDDEVVGWMSICFSCYFLLWSPNILGHADKRFYEFTQELFFNFGYNKTLEY